VGHADASNYGFESAVYILSADNGAKLNSAQFAKLVTIFGTFAAVAAPISPAKESPVRNRSAPSHKVKTYVLKRMKSIRTGSIGIVN